MFVERVLNRHNRYVQWIEQLIELGIVGTSSQAEPEGVEKAADGAILRWPLYRDTLTVQPMEPRMISENYLQAFKALGIELPALDNTEAEPEPTQEASPEVEDGGPSAVDVAKARLRLQRFFFSLEE